MTYRPREKPSRRLLNDFRGTIDAGEMLLVIGKPGSGCTTFLKTLANMRGEYREFLGEILYGGRSPTEMVEANMADFTFCGTSR